MKHEIAKIGELSPDARIRMNTQTLFGVIDGLKDDDKTIYYGLQYDDKDPKLIEGVTTLDLRPTGARREEVRGPMGRGVFHQAQYRVGEISTIDDVQEPYYAWLPTFPSGSSDEPVINEVRLLQDTGFRALNTGNITSSLLEGIDSLEEHLCLIDAVKSRDMRVTKELQRRVKILGGRAILSILDSEWKGGSDRPRANVALQEIFETMANVDKKVERSLQGRAISVILHTLPYDLDKKIDIAKRDDVLDTLKFGLESGLFPRESRIYSRFLLHPAVYQDPYFVKYLESTLERKNVNRQGSKSILGTERETAAHDIMAAMLYAKVMDPDRSGNASERTRSVIRNQRLIRHFVRDRKVFDPFFQLADDLGYAEATGKEKEHIGRDRKDNIMKYYEITEAFKFILAEIEKDQPSEESAKLDDSKVRSMKHILLPRAEQRMHDMHIVADVANEAFDGKLAKQTGTDVADTARNKKLAKAIVEQGAVK